MNKEIALSYKILNNVYFEGAYSSIELNKNQNPYLNFAMVTKIVYGVLDNDFKLDYFVKQFYKKAPKKQVELYFKIAAYIKLNLSMPDFAIVNEIVKILKTTKFKMYSGFCNAVLKQIVTTEFKLPSKNDYTKYLAVLQGKPIWFIELLLKNFEQPFVEEYLNAKLTTDTHIRVNTLKTTFSDFENNLKQFGIKYAASPLTDCFYVDFAELNKIQELKNLYACQGITSMLVAKNANGNKILDVCAAPGGKAVLAATNNSNSTVIACDIHEHRVKLIEQYILDMGATNVTAQNLDATKLHNAFVNQFDCVIVDAPCSGLGVINKKPDLLLKAANVLELTELQNSILENVKNYVNVGGHIIYSTCSILPQENEQVLNNFLLNNKNFRVAEVNTFNILNKDVSGFKSFYPNISNTEGFFIGKIVRYE